MEEGGGMFEIRGKVSSRLRRASLPQRELCGVEVPRGEG